MTFLLFPYNTLFCGAFIKGALSGLGMSIRTHLFHSFAILDLKLHVNIWLGTHQKGLEYPCLVIDQVPSCYILKKQTSVDG